MVGVYDTRPVSQAFMANVALRGQLRRSVEVAGITEGAKSDEDDDYDDENSEIWQGDSGAELSHAMALNDRLPRLEVRVSEGSAAQPKVKSWIKTIFRKRRRGGEEGHAGWKSIPRMGSSPGEG